MATITLPAHLVKKACLNYIDHVDKRIVAERERLIQRKMQTRKYFFGPKYTYESAKESLEQDTGAFSEWYRIKWEGSYWYTCAQDLLALANYANEIVLNEEEVWIMKWVNK